MPYQLWKLTFFISLFLFFTQSISAAKDVEPIYQYFQLQAEVEPEIPKSDRNVWPWVPVESPFHVEIKSKTINKKVHELRSSPEGSFENFAFKYFTALDGNDKNFLKEHTIFDNPQAIEISMEHRRKSASINAVIKNCFYIGDSIHAILDSPRSQYPLHYSFFLENETYKLSCVDNVGPVIGLLNSLKPASKDQVSKLKHKVEISLKDQMPVKNKAYLYFDAKPIDQKVNKDSPNQNEFVDRPKWLLYQDLVRAVEKVDRAKIREIALPLTYNSFIKEFQWNLGNGFQIYLRPLLETKHFRLEVENDRLSFCFFQNQYVSEKYPYEILMLRKIGENWKITNFHGGSVLEQLLLEPAMQKQVIQLFK